MRFRRGLWGATIAGGTPVSIASNSTNFALVTQVGGSPVLAYEKPCACGSTSKADLRTLTRGDGPILGFSIPHSVGGVRHFSIVGGTSSRYELYRDNPKPVRTEASPFPPWEIWAATCGCRRRPSAEPRCQPWPGPFWRHRRLRRRDCQER